MFQRYDTSDEGVATCDPKRQSESWWQWWLSSSRLLETDSALLGGAAIFESLTSLLTKYLWLGSG